ncbi:hypothetical protein PRZ48_013063 [Zasmidium cellare]|uniref:CFEM domain-containing protein n=1 Tax=Zasmidium cellare TaxID=395010 RepID=A0ABR0E326_ZASCE|nr:hypothetical protein PRZ48_013063 [Zasmidium cellare]
MHFTTTALAAAGLAAHQALAFGGGYGGGGWGGPSKYSTPDNTDNECSPAQASGYDWSGLSQGSFSSYGSNNFNGWSCSNSFGKRDLLTKRTFQSKCITAPLDDQPSIGCEGDKTMSLDKFEVSSDKDADIECHYDMPDGSTCKEVHSCNAGGTVIQNSQCGGARSVTFKPAGDKSSGCNIGVHSVGFNCGSASSIPPAYSSTAPPSYSTPSIPAYSYSTSSASIPEHSSSSESSPASDSTSTPSAPGYSSPSIPAYSSSESTPAYSSSSSSVETSPVTPSTSSTPSAPGYSSPSSSESSPVTPTTPAYSTGSVPSYNVTSSYPIGSGSAPGYSSPSIPSYGGGSSSSTEVSPVTTSPSIISYSTSTVYSTTLETITSCAPTVTNCPAKSGSSAVVTKTVAISTTICPITAAETSAAPTGYTPQPESGDTLPKCLNSWMYLTSCKGNDDYDCFCKNKDFITKVWGCVSAWSGSHDETQGSGSYLMGLCAPYVPQNPAIITACPSSVTPAASYSYSPQTSPAPSSPASSPEGQTITLYSTKEETITSCAPEVTNCPAKTHTTSYAIGTTVTTAPASTEISPIGSSPAPTAPASVPCTTITYSTVYPVPATYTTGSSVGATIPSSSITTSLLTTVTVPQVQITTYTVTSGGSTTTQPGLGYGSPSPVVGPTGAAPSAPAPAPYPTTSVPGPVGPIGGSTGLGTTYLPTPSPSSSPITPYTGAGAKISGSGFLAVVLGAVAVLM